MAERILLLLIAVCGVARLSHAGDQFIRIKPVATVSETQEQVVLGDIAEITSPATVSDETIQNLSALVMFQKSEVADGAVTSAQVTDQLRKHSAKLAGFQVIVPQQITINFRAKSDALVSGRQLDRSAQETAKISRRIESEISKKLLSWGVIGNWTIEVRNLKLPLGSRVTSEDRMNLSAMSVRPKGVTSIPLTLFDTKTGTDSTIWVQGDVHYTASVPVLTRNVQAGQNISQADVRMEKRDVTFVNDALASFEELAALPQAALSLNQGSILVKSSLQRELAARRGEEITITAGGNEFKVSAKGLAEGQGYVGDLIRVKNLQSQKSLMGTLISKGTVRVGY